jgi:hypothetical protein
MLVRFIAASFQGEWFGRIAAAGVGAVRRGAGDPGADAVGFGSIEWFGRCRLAALRSSIAGASYHVYNVDVNENEPWFPTM